MYGAGPWWMLPSLPGPALSIWLNYSPTDTGDAAAEEAFNNAALDEEP